MIKNRRNARRGCVEDRELTALLLAVSGTLLKIAGNLQILCVKRQMKGDKYGDNRTGSRARDLW